MVLTTCYVWIRSQLCNCTGNQEKEMEKQRWFGGRVIRVSGRVLTPKFSLRCWIWSRVVEQSKLNSTSLCKSAPLSSTSILGGVEIVWLSSSSTSRRDGTGDEAVLNRPLTRIQIMKPTNIVHMSRYLLIKLH